jgi:transposase-like protein
MQEPQTLMEAIYYFSDSDVCQSFIANLRWPDGVTCLTCGAQEVRYISTRRLYECKKKHPRRQFSVRVGTIFEDSPLGLDKWLAAIWMIANDKNGISSYEVHRALGITQKSAWFLVHRVRLAMQTGTFQKLDGEVEIDETFVGGKARNMHSAGRKRKITGRGGAGKAIVMELLERNGAVRTAVVPNRAAPTLQRMVREEVADGAYIYTDGVSSYNGLDARYIHDQINHAERYVGGIIHTNGIEIYWSLLKRMIHGTYVSVSPEHLSRYLMRRRSASTSATRTTRAGSGMW